MKKDITTAEDVRLLVDTFYKNIENDNVIGYIFKDVMDVNWDEHLEKMYGFWQILILGIPGLKSNPVQKHILINSKERLTETHFDQWVKVWFKTLDDLFEGENVETAKVRTKSMQHNLMMQIEASEA